MSTWAGESPLCRLLSSVIFDFTYLGRNWKGKKLTTSPERSWPDAFGAATRVIRPHEKPAAPMMVPLEWETGS
jgi:hypothetical protein